MYLDNECFVFQETIFMSASSGKSTSTDCTSIHLAMLTTACAVHQYCFEEDSRLCLFSLAGVVGSIELADIGTVVVSILDNSKEKLQVDLT